MTDSVLEAGRERKGWNLEIHDYASVDLLKEVLGSPDVVHEFHRVFFLKLRGKWTCIYLELVAVG